MYGQSTTVKYKLLILNNDKKKFFFEAILAVIEQNKQFIKMLSYDTNTNTYLFSEAKVKSNEDQWN